MLTQSGSPLFYGLWDPDLAVGIQICFTVARLVPLNTNKGSGFGHPYSLSLQHHLGSRAWRMENTNQG